MGRIDLAAALDFRADDVGARGSCQIGQFSHLVSHRFRARPGQQDANQVSPLSRGLSRDQSLSFLILDIASSSRSSGAVTESRK